MEKSKGILITVLLIASCESTSYSKNQELNETEYDRMPPLLHLDDYRRCQLNNKAVYCLTKFTLHGELGNPLIQLIHDYSSDHLKRYNHSYIERGVCLRRTCFQYLKEKNLDDNEEVRDVLQSCVNESIYKKYGLEARLDTVYNCERSNEPLPEKDLSDWLVAGYFIALLTLVVLGTLYDAIFVCKDGKERNSYEGIKYLLCFSLFRSWQRLVLISEDEQNENTFQFLHGIRCLVAFFVIYVHSLIIFGALSDDFQQYELAYNTPYLIIFNGLPVVYILIAMSGTFMIMWIRKVEEHWLISWKTLPILLMGRWWRLAMPYIAVLSLTSTWFRYAGSGPLWGHVVMSSVSTCRKYWWAHLLFVNNFIAEDAACMYQTWSLAADMQLSALGLVVYIATINRPRARNITLATLILLGLVIPSVQVLLGDFDAAAVANPEIYRAGVSAESNRTFVLMHVRTQNNLLAYVIGMSFGFYIDHCQKNKNIYNFNKKFCNLLIWVSFLGIFMVFLTMNYFQGATLYTRVVYAALHRIGFAVLALGIAIPAILKLDDTWLRKLMEWRGWVVPSRLSYLVYLLHINFILYILATSRQMVQFSFTNTFQFQLGVTCITLLAALPMYMIVEGPMSALLKCVLTNNRSQSRKKTI